MWLAAELWKRIDERKGNRAKYREVKQTTRHVKGEFSIAFIRESGYAAESNDFRGVYSVNSELECCCKLVHSPGEDVNGRLPIYDDERLKRWKERFTKVLNSITLTFELNGHVRRTFLVTILFSFC